MSVSTADQPAATAAGSNDDGDEFVLPWWYSWWRVGLITAALTAGLIGFFALLIGGRAPGPDSVDVGFLQDMRHHHDQAVQMSMIYRNAADTDNVVGIIADEVLLSQSQGTGMMIEIMRGFGAEEENTSGMAMRWMGHEMTLDQMPGLASDAEIEALVAADGAAADQLFVKLMTAHHEGGIEMAEYAAEHASNDRVQRLAAAMARSQRTEIIEMNDIAATLG